MNIGPSFFIEIRYAQILNMVFVTFLYGSGLPLLYLFGMVEMFLIYWVDKYCRTNL